VVAAYARVYVPEELAPLGDGHASLQDVGGGALVQLAVDESEGLGHPSDAPGLGPVRREFPSVHPGDILVTPVHLAGGWFDVHGFGLVGAIPLEQGEHVRLVRGVLIHGLCARWIRGSPRGSRAVRGVRLGVDGRLGDVSSEDVRGDGDPPRRDLGKLVRLLIIPTGHVVELDVVELVLEGPHCLAVRIHLIVVATRIFHDVVDHELRVPPHVEAFDAYFDGDLEAAK
jgi:hypothetical protein